MDRDARVARMPRSDGRTLSSILSLAAGAAAFTPAGDADADTISYGTFSPAITVGIGVGQSSLSLGLPTAGDVEIAAVFEPAIKTTTFNSRAFIVARGKGGDAFFGVQASTRSFNTYPGKIVAFRTSAGADASASTPNWNAPERKSTAAAGAFILSSVNKRFSLTNPPPNYSYQWKGYGPGSFPGPGKYLLFKFTDGGSGFNYGWIHLSSGTSDPGNPSAMSVTIDGWAYRTGGLPIGAGQTHLSPSAVPEIDPASATGALAAAAGALSLLEQRRRRGAGEAMGGALVSGAAGLRRWRTARGSAAAERQSVPVA